MMSVIPDVNDQKAFGYEVFNLTIICPKLLMLLKQIQSLGVEITQAHIGFRPSNFTFGNNV